MRSRELTEEGVELQIEPERGAEEEQHRSSHELGANLAVDFSASGSTSLPRGSNEGLPDESNGGPGNSELSEEEIRKLFWYCSNRPGDYLDAQLRRMTNFLSTTDSWKIFCSSTPFAAMLSSHWGKFGLTALSLYMAMSMYVDGAFGEQSRMIHHFTQFKFTTLKLSNGTAAPEILNPGVEEFGMLSHGDRLSNPDISTTGPSIFLVYPEVQAVKGWWVLLGPQGQGPVRFTVHGSNDGVSWHQLVHSQRCRSDLEAPETAEYQLGRDSAGKLEVLDWFAYDCSWPAILSFSVARCLVVVTLVLSLIIVSFGRGQMATQVVGMGFLFIACCRLVSAVELSRTHRADQAADGWISFMSLLMFPGTILLWEARFLEIGVLSALVGLAGRIFVMLQYPWMDLPMIDSGPAGVFLFHKVS